MNYSEANYFFLNSFREAQGMDVHVYFIYNGSRVLFGIIAALCSSPQGKNCSCRQVTLGIAIN